MQLFVGLKRVIAAPMTRGEYNEYRNWENPEDEGYLDGGSSNHPEHENHISCIQKMCLKKLIQLMDNLIMGMP